jgi:hypothetical protein
MLGAVSNHERISEGADPDCLPTENGGHVSWIVRDPKTELWTINLSSFDSDMRLSATSSTATDVANLVTRPYLAQFEGEPCLIYLNTDRRGRTAINTYFIESHLALEEKLITVSPNDMVVKWSARYLVATIETKEELCVLSFDGRNWKVVANIPKEGSIWPYRFDFALGDNTAMFVMEFEQRQRIGTLVLDLSNGTFDRKWAICDYGKFPSIATTNGRWLISWVGEPALPLDLQGKGVSPDNSRAYLDALNKIRLEAEAAENKAGKDRKRRSEMEKIWGVSYVPPWAPLWLGILGDSGECTKTYGPLGGGTDENFGTQISMHGDRGILMWRSRDNHATEDEEGCFLKAREITLSKSKTRARKT